MPIISFNGKVPRIGRGVFIANTAYVIGDVDVGDEVSLWPYAVVRGDEDSISIGRFSNLQDHVVVHTDRGIRTVIGEGVTIGHRAIVHGARINDYVLVGMGAILLNNAEVGEYSIIGAGAVVTEGTRIPPRSVAVGVPARVIRSVTDDDVRRIIDNYKAYLELAKLYSGSNL
ncbi:gamma carbonic anhydrase family protein [Caldivirga sp. UBA161]|uniref:gamma carbonic anhydrase family protein n=1 Tax=Caldivirga sp. UBA161 TaxID=1915569 RepID=UPI0025C5256B|nr:gamma carbonic anhydrase family protein [Caldivirga sp. UBA161]